MIGDVRMITMSCCRSAKGQVFVMDLRLFVAEARRHPNEFKP